MVLIPLIFFLIFFLRLYTSRGLDISSAMAFMYLISSIAAVILYYVDDITYFDYSTIDLHLLPTIIYCLMNALIILPFTKIQSNRKKELNLSINIKLFNTIAYGYILIFVFFLVVYAPLVASSFGQNLADTRAEYYAGDAVDLTKGMGTLMKLVFYAVTMFGGGSCYMLIFFFYSICFLRKSNFFNIAILISSMTGIIGGVAIADRSNIFYWALFLILSYLLFRPYMNKKAKRIVYTLGGLFSVVFLIYFTLVTLMRFSTFDGGASGGIFAYLGQPYIEFCNFWNHRDLYGDYTFGRVFPLSNVFLNHSLTVGEFAELLRLKYGISLGVFFSIPGLYLADIGKFASVFFPVLIYYIINKNIRKANTPYFSLSSSLRIYLWAIIPMSGIITFYYLSYSRVFALLIFIYLTSKLNRIK